MEKNPTRRNSKTSQTKQKTSFSPLTQKELIMTKAKNIVKKSKAILRNRKKSTQQSRIPISDDVLLYIIQMLPYKEQQNTRYVCKQFRDVIPTPNLSEKQIMNMQSEIQQVLFDSLILLTPMSYEVFKKDKNIEFKFYDLYHNKLYIEELDENSDILTIFEFGRYYGNLINKVLNLSKKPLNEIYVYLKNRKFWRYDFKATDEDGFNLITLDKMIEILIRLFKNKIKDNNYKLNIYDTTFDPKHKIDLDESRMIEKETENEMEEYFTEQAYQIKNAIGQYFEDLYLCKKDKQEIIEDLFDKYINL
jgi:hypothetical protein